MTKLHSKAQPVNMNRRAGELALSLQTQLHLRTIKDERIRTCHAVPPGRNERSTTMPNLSP
ncbi:hypothetical protein SAMN02982919_01650 [Giesbergeria anulus]|uniref:Uncharacterized protein n=1 Tax=Giesbergeria anulus TaxID=180197 RepID=A0A1H9KSM9_9BURK|nr:hypothetical protein SAMN02982919_01650 [Giesbergeria anulus]